MTKYEEENVKGGGLRKWKKLRLMEGRDVTEE